jgi:hypothetical protein
MMDLRHSPLASSALCLTVLLLSPVPSAAQSRIPGRPSGVWLTVGLGAGWVHETAFAGAASLSYRSGASVLVWRATAVAELFGDSMWDTGLLYGRATRTRVSEAWAAVGVGLADGTRSSSLFGQEHQLSSVVGIPLEAHVTWTPASWFGLGLYGFADVNHAQSFAGVALGVELGLLQ